MQLDRIVGHNPLYVGDLPFRSFGCISRRAQLPLERPLALLQPGRVGEGRVAAPMTKVVQRLSLQNSEGDFEMREAVIGVRGTCSAQNC